MSVDAYEQIWACPAEERTLAETNKMFAWIEELTSVEENEDE